MRLAGLVGHSCRIGGGGGGHGCRIGGARLQDWGGTVVGLVRLVGHSCSGARLQDWGGTVVGLVGHSCRIGEIGGAQL